METDIDKEVFFCSAASRYFKEDLNGTASNSKVFILIEYSNPFPEKVALAQLDKSWLNGVQQLAKSLKGKTLLIRNKKSNFKDCRIVFVDCVRCAYFIIETNVNEYHSIDISTHIYAPETKWQTDPFFVICTNGKKDKCCAKFGFPVFKFFESFNADVRVWESTHLGGDRFAANVVAFPFGIYYGHVMVEDVGHIMVRTLLRKIYKNKYRGLSQRSFFEQAIECHLRDHLQNYDIDFNINIHLLQQEEELSHVEVNTSSNGKFIMELQKEIIPYPHMLTCKSKKPENIAKYLLINIQQQ